MPRRSCRDIRSDQETETPQKHHAGGGRLKVVAIKQSGIELSRSRRVRPRVVDVPCQLRQMAAALLIVPTSAPLRLFSSPVHVQYMDCAFRSPPRHVFRELAYITPARNVHALSLLHDPHPVVTLRQCHLSPSPGPNSPSQSSSGLPCRGPNAVIVEFNHAGAV